MKFYYNEMEFLVPESVYYPREDSLLMAKVLEGIDLTDKRVLEIGCGCGFLSILLAKGGAGVAAVDINQECAEITKSNAKANNAAIGVFVSDLFSNVDGVFDLIILNPPYLPVDEKDATYAGGQTGRGIIERFIANVKNHLNPNGAVLMVISSLTGEKEVVELFEKEGMKTQIAAREKIPWEELIVIRACL